MRGRHPPADDDGRDLHRAIAPIIATGSNLDLGLPAVFGGVIAAGIFTLVAAPCVGRLVRWFPPVDTSTVGLVIGISLMRVGIHWAAGDSPTIMGPNGPMPNPNYGVPLHLGISAGVLAIILLVIATCRGFVANVAVLIGIGAGFAVALALGKVSFSGLDAAGWVQPITPFHFGWPSFDAMTAVSLCVVMIVIMIEGVGQFLALGEVVGRKIGPDDIARGLRVDGVGAIVGGVFNTFTYTSTTQNIGLVQVTGVRSRWVCVAAGVILIVLGSLPKLAVLAASIPQVVLGGAALAMFGMVAATGIRILGHVDFVHHKKNGYVVAISVALGMIPQVADKFFAQLPDLAAKFFSNGILLGTFSAVLLNVVMNAREGAPPASRQLHAAHRDCPSRPGGVNPAQVEQGGRAAFARNPPGDRRCSATTLHARRHLGRAASMKSNKHLRERMHDETVSGTAVSRCGLRQSPGASSRSAGRHRPIARRLRPGSRRSLRSRHRAPGKRRCCTVQAGRCTMCSMPGPGLGRRCSRNCRCRGRSAPPPPRGSRSPGAASAPPSPPAPVADRRRRHSRH